MSSVKNLITAIPEGRVQKKNGGYRPGSGRKKKLIKFATQNEAYNAWVDTIWEDLLEAQKALAMGHFVSEVGKDGQERTYFKSPDKGMLEYMMNRRMGKPAESVDLTSKGNELTSVHVYLPKRNAKD